MSKVPLESKNIRVSMVCLSLPFKGQNVKMRQTKSTGKSNPNN